MPDPATIFALSSGHGRAGVAVIRVSGPAAGPVLDHMAAPRPKPRYAGFRRIHHPETSERLDEALVLWLPGPGSETGEDMAELQIHGGTAVIRAVLTALATVPGCRMAEPGEFARRAFENGRLDLTAAEGLADLIDAETEAQRRQALAQAGGGLTRLYDGWRTDLLEARALVEAAIDFSDEADVATDAMAQATRRAATLHTAIAAHLADGNRGEIIRDGFRVVLAGPPNVGKSSLLNALARRDVAIVSEEAGTTRDVLEVRLNLNGYAVILADTAGIREATGRVELEGIRRAVDLAQSADLVVWLIDATDPNLIQPAAAADMASRRLLVMNKIDARDLLRPTPLPPGAIGISALTGEGLADLIGRISTEIEQRIGATTGLPPSQQRHRMGLEACLTALNTYAGGSIQDTELRAEDLRQAADALARIVGRIDAEEVLGAVFSRFCIGK